MLGAGPVRPLGGAGVVFSSTNENTLVTWGRRRSLSTLRDPIQSDCFWTRYHQISHT